MTIKENMKDRMQNELENLVKERYKLSIKDIQRLMNKISRKKSISLLTEEEKTILTLKFDLNNTGEKYTLEAIGNVLSMSKSNVSLKMHHALAKLYGYNF